MKIGQIVYVEDFRKQNLRINKGKSAFFGNFCVHSYWFGRFYKVFLYFCSFFKFWKCFHNFEHILENIVRMKSFTDPICHNSSDLSPKPDLSPLFSHAKMWQIGGWTVCLKFLILTVENNLCSMVWNVLASLLDPDSEDSVELLKKTCDIIYIVQHISITYF